MAVAQGSKPVKKASAPKKSKSSPSHPPYIEMITEALVSLKERTGSSHYAIAKHIEEQQKVRDLPPNFKKLLSVQLKKFVASGKLVKIKNSFKLPPTAAKKSSPEAAPKPKPKAKEATEKKTKKETKTTTTAKPKAKTTENSKAKTTQKTAAKKKVPVAKKPKSIKSPMKKPKSIKSPAKATKKAPAAKKAKK